jgi:hypothetical protein
MVGPAFPGAALGKLLEVGIVTPPDGPFSLKVESDLLQPKPRDITDGTMNVHAKHFKSFIVLPA